MNKVKRIIAMLLTSIMAFSLVACGGKAAADSKTTQPSSEPTQNVEVKEDTKEEKKTPGSLTLYTSHKEDVFSPIVKEFQERTGIQVDIVSAGTGEILKRIEAEAQSGNPLGDVMFGGGVESLEAYKEYFDPYVTSEDANIGDAFKAADNTWTGFSALPMVIMYNTKLVSESEIPTSWADVTDPKWKGKIAFTDPALSGSCFTTMVTMLTAYKDRNDGWDFIKEFVENLDGKLLKSSGDIYKGVADGEYSLGLTLEEAAQKYVVAGSDVGFIYPLEGTSAVPDGTAIIKGGPNLENAKLFLDFTVSQDVQNLIVSNMSRRAVRSDIAPAEGLAPIDSIKLVDYDIPAASANKDAIMARWKDILVGR